MVSMLDGVLSYYYSRLPCIRLYTAVLAAIGAFASAQVYAAGGICTADDTKVNPAYSPRSQSMDGRTSQQLRRCYVDYKRAATMWQRNIATLIDVRSQRSFERYSIPKSLHMPLYTIKTKHFLKKQNIILFDEGKNSIELLKACFDLKQKGFKHVSVLAGGMNQWLRARAPLNGMTPGFSDVYGISPQEVATASENWRIFSTEKDPAAVQKLFPDRKVEVLSAGRSGLSVQFKNIKQDERVLVVNRNGFGYESVHVKLAEQKVKNQFYLTGGTDAYKNYLTSQAALLKKVRSGPYKPSTCKG